MLVTGASGFVGRHVLRAAGAAGWELIAPPSAALDVNDDEVVVREVREWRPHAIVHLAYRKDDPRTIVNGSANVARAAAAVRARLVHVSSDAVFAGRPAPYTEDDTAGQGAVGEYGRAKAEAEREVLERAPRAVVVRTSLVYGTWAVAPIQRDVELALGGRTSMRFFTDEVRCPIHGDDLAAALVTLSSRRAVTGPLHVAGPTAVTRADFARIVARWMHLDPHRVPTSTIADSGLARQGRIVLDTSRAAALGLRARTPEDALGLAG